VENQEKELLLQMDTRKMAVEYRMAQWARLMRERSEKGVSVREFCRANGIHENTYYYRQRKLRETAYELMTEGPGAAVAEQTPPGFVRVVRHEGNASSDEQGMNGRLHVEVDRVRITTDSTYPTDRLAALLRELVRP
jgi:transposase-like protein